MKKISNFLKNPFWHDKNVLILFYICLALIIFYWAIYFLEIRENILPFILGTSFFILNFILAIFAFRKNKFVSFLLIGTAFFIQILTFVLVRYLIFYKSF